MLSLRTEPLLLSMLSLVLMKVASLLKGEMRRGGRFQITPNLVPILKLSIHLPAVGWSRETTGDHKVDVSVR